MIDAGNIMSVADVNQNFSRAASLADANGEMIIVENNQPKYLLVDIENNPYIDMTDDEKIDVVAARILRQHRTIRRQH